MPRYRRIPIEVEAVQWLKAGDHPHVLSFIQKFTTRILRQGATPCPICKRVMSKHGFMTSRQGSLVPVCPGDWLVEQEGVWTLCRQDMFPRMFEPISESTDGADTGRKSETGSQEGLDSQSSLG